MIRLLSIGNDPTIALPPGQVVGDTHQRQLAYASILGAHHLITRAPHSRSPMRLELADNLGLDIILPDFEGGIVWVESPLDVNDDPIGLPTALALKQNYPNPFNPSTTIAYSLPERSQVTLKIFNILGQEVETLVDEVKPAGEYEVTWRSDTNASGLYFYRLNYKGKVLTKKMTLLK